MAPNESGEALSAQLQRLERKLEDLQAAQNSAKWTSRLVAVVITAVAVSLVLRMIWPLYEAGSNPKPYLDAIQKDAAPRVQALLQQEANLAVKELLPALQASTKAVLEKKWPKAEKTLETEYKFFLEHLQDRLAKELADRTQKMVDYHFNRMKKEFPELSNPDNAEKLLAVAQKRTEAAFGRVLADHLENPLTTLTAMNSSFEKIPISDDVHAMTGPALQDHAVTIITRLLNEKFKGHVEFAEEMGQRAMELMEKNVGAEGEKAHNLMQETLEKEGIVPHEGMPDSGSPNQANPDAGKHK